MCPRSLILLSAPSIDQGKGDSVLKIFVLRCNNSIVAWELDLGLTVYQNLQTRLCYITVDFVTAASQNQYFSENDKKH